MNKVLTALFLSLVVSGSFTDAAEKKKVFYDPITKNVEGWTIRVDPKLLAPGNKEVSEQAFGALTNHLQRVKYIVDAEHVRQLQKLPIWMDLSHPELTNMQYHPSKKWLIEHGHDPRLAKHVHLPQAERLYARYMWAKHPYVVMHELAHAYHDQVIGYGHPAILSAYEDAKRRGIYEKVLLHTGRRTRHYSLTNHKEYFAESTEAYFGVNDFYPFVRAELKEHDPRMFQVMEQFWGKIER